MLCATYRIKKNNSPSSDCMEEGEFLFVGREGTEALPYERKQNKNRPQGMGAVGYYA